MMLRPPPSLDIVVHCYNEEAVLPKTARQLELAMDALLSSGSVASEPPGACAGSFPG